MADKRIAVSFDFLKNQIKNVAVHNVTTAQRTTLGGTLGSSNKGVIVTDTDEPNVYYWNGSAWVNLSQVVTNAMTVKGEISNANTNPSYPASPSVGDVWMVTTNAGTVGGTTVEVGDQLIYSTSGWFVLQANLGAASETAAGYIEIATQAETNTGTDDARAITPLKLKTNLDLNRPKIYRQTIASLATATPTVITHNLALGNANDYIVQFRDSTGSIVLSDIGTSVNSITIEQSTGAALTNLEVVVVGL
ncbi:MAG TPA: hypothetical protein PK453_12215 [Leptospiraceae bacterium]|nr:hypothetical protein [Leptospiraceae bacterium]HNF62938.1 hypothetical protein [Rhodocyclaceae bacterium]HNM05599.1 hypothetical protein [Leptospiraceae bacterium]